MALEALFRWVDEDWGNIAPGEAVAIAREFRLLDPLSLIVVRASCRAARALPHLRVSINVEASQLFDTAFVSGLEAAIDVKGVDSSRLILEIGEGDIAAHGAKIEPMLSALAAAGFALAVDNFGTSNVSLSYLARLGVTHVKLDRSQLSNAREAGTIAVIRAKVQLARSLGLLVTCEAISDRTEEDIALQAECNFLQGYRYCRPQPLDAYLAAAWPGSLRVA